MPDVGLKQVWSALMVSVALAPMAIAFGFLVKGLKGANPVALIMAGIAIPIMAWGIVQASEILQGVKDIPLGKVLTAGLGVGLATLAMVPTIYLLNKAGLLNPSSILSLLIGVAAIILISTAVMVSSWILSVGKYDKFPSFEWAAGVGLSMIAFTLPTIALGLLIMTGVGALALLAGMAGIFMIAGTIVGVAEILNKYDWKNTQGPSLEWSGSVGLALMGFGLAILLAAPLAVLGGVMSFFGGDIGDGLYGIVDVIIGVAQRFNDSSKVDWATAKHPTKEWAEGVGGAIMGFASALAAISDVGSNSFVQVLTLGLGGNGGMDAKKFVDACVTMAEGMIAVALVLNGTTDSFWTNARHPSKEWGEGVGAAIGGFATGLAAFASSGADVDGEDLNDEDGAVAIMKALAQAIIDVAVIFNNSRVKFDINAVPSKEWGESIGDTLKAFADGLKAIDEVGMSSIMKLGMFSGVVVGYAFTMSKLPKLDQEKISTIINSISGIISVLPTQKAVDPLWDLIIALEKLSEVSWGDLFNIKTVSNLIQDLSEQINKLDNSKIDSLNKLGAGLHIISLIDQEQLKKTLDVLEAKSNTISEIMDDGSFIKGIFNSMIDTISGPNMSTTEKNQATVNKQGTPETKSKFEDELISYIKNIDINIGKMANLETEEKEERLKAKDVEDKEKAR